MSLNIEFSSVPPLETLGPPWQELESRSDNSFYLSWTWIGTWLEEIVFPHFDLSRIRLCRVWDGSRLVGLGIISAGGSGLDQGRSAGRFFLNETGVAALDRTTIEYNSFLSERGRETEVLLAALTAILDPSSVHELPWGDSFGRLNCITEECAEVLRNTRIGHYILRSDTCPIISRFGEGPDFDAYLSSLNKNTRAQLRRAIKLLGGQDRIDVTPASTEAIPAFFSELKSLHCAAWRARKGYSGAFGDPIFSQFAERLVTEGHKRGHVELIRVSNADHTIGILMNFKYRGRICAYQTGLTYADDNRVKPGLVCHALAAHHAFKDDYQSYHFMAGESRYKQSLGNAQESLFWAEVGHPGFRWWTRSLELNLRRVAKQFLNWSLPSRRKRSI